MIRKCETCIHWTQDKRVNDPEGWGRCDLAQSEDGKAVNRESLAVAWDQETYYAALLTHKDFWCCQHVRREKT